MWSGQPGPGSADHTARGLRPSASAARKDGPSGYWSHSAGWAGAAPELASAAWAGGGLDADLLAAAGRGGMARRRTSAIAPPSRSATPPAIPANPSGTPGTADAT